MNPCHTTYGIILAAGQGKRMQSDIPKVMHLIGNKPLILWVIESLHQAGLEHIVVVISTTTPALESFLNSLVGTISGLHLSLAYQNEALGTAHAAHCGIESIVQRLGCTDFQANNPPQFLVAYGDTPAVHPSSYKNLYTYHHLERLAFSILAFRAKDPFGYGRIQWGASQEFMAIVEEKDCSEAQKHINLCNSGILCGDVHLFRSLYPCIKANNAARELYLTDIPTLARQQGHAVGVIENANEQELQGINTPQQLAQMKDYLLG